SQMHLSFSIQMIAVILIISPIIESAKFCYSGRGATVPTKQCGNGGDASQYACQTFKCEGGKSPFTLRTCANKNMGCMAGPAICKYSQGTGSCMRCENDNCNILN
ncbi:hypothetical protein PRIPAC_70351, partial [Pristionchus pacificus]|uniref:Secreted protein n=1 Tax=Pristionchus pacificus TaxID=54126 RepID=A0A8R1Z9N3_PRIPA